MHKKGMMSIETIIIIILALLVLVIVAAAFSGGMKELWNRIIGISESTGELTLEQATAKCKGLCSNQNIFCSTSFPVKDAGPRNCKELTSCAGATWTC
jgi:ABC-type lipoprotein release transport system permease subunit